MTLNNSEKNLSNLDYQTIIGWLSNHYLSDHAKNIFNLIDSLKRYPELTIKRLKPLLHYEDHLLVTEKQLSELIISQSDSQKIKEFNNLIDEINKIINKGSIATEEIEEITNLSNQALALINEKKKNQL